MIVGLCVAIGIAVSWLASFRPRYVLYASTFLSPLIPTAFGYSLVESSIIVSPTRVVELVLVMAFVIAATRGGLLRRHFPLAAIFAFYLVIRMIGVIIAPEKAGALIQLFGEAGLFTMLLGYIAFSVIRNREQFDRLITTVLASGCLISCIGICERITERDFSGNVLMPLIGKTLENWDTIELKAGLIPRVRATLDHPLALAGLMVFLFPFALQRAIVRSGLARVLYFGITGLLGVALFLSFSRIAQLAVLLETIAMLWFYSRKLMTWLLAITVGIGVIVLASIYKKGNEAPVGEKPSSLLFPVRTISLIGGRWVELGKAFAAHPYAAIIGFGFTRFTTDAYAPETMTIKDLSAFYSNMDTDVLRVLAVTGILGFISWAGIFLVFLKRLISSKRVHPYSARQAPLLALAIAVPGCMLTALPGTSVLTYTQTWPIIAVCMCAGLGILPRVVYKHVAIERTRWPQPAVVGGYPSEVHS